MEIRAKELKNIIVNEFNNIENSINNNMSQGEKEKYVSDIAEKYGVSRNACFKQLKNIEKKWDR